MLVKGCWSVGRRMNFSFRRVQVNDNNNYASYNLFAGLSDYYLSYPVNRPVAEIFNIATTLKQIFSIA